MIQLLRWNPEGSSGWWCRLDRENGTVQFSIGYRMNIWEPVRKLDVSTLRNLESMLQNGTANDVTYTQLPEGI